MKKKLLSVLLVVCMVLTLMPMTALADFADTEGHWGKNAIDRWAAEGVLNGKGEDVFDPNGNMTRAEFAQMLCNLMGYTKKAENTFADVPDDAWYADAILKLVEAGVLNGVGNNMAAPNAPITREMAAVMLCRAFDLKASSASMSFSDANQVSGWAAGAVAALTEKGMMNGVGDNKVAPQLNINRASVATLIDNMVADYVTGDKTITGEVNGIIVVAGDAKVTFEDATVTAPVIVAPAAEGAEVELTGTTTAENVVVAAEKAAVTVGKDASAETVTAAAAKAEVKVEGKVDAVEVTGEDAKVAVSGTAESVAVSGEGAKVDVSGSVGTVSTEAANTSVAVSGTVEKVEVAEGADKTEITAASGAKIDSVTTSAEDVKVSGSGEVGSVTADNGSVDVTTKGTEVKNEGADSVTAGSTTVEEGETATSDGTTGSSSGGSGSSSKPKNAVDIVAAPLHDNADAEVAITNDKQLGTVSVSSTKVSDNEYNVVITGTKIMNHNNASGTTGHWVGFGMLIPTNAEGKAVTCTYKNGREDMTSAYGSRTCENGGKTYNTAYFSCDTVDEFKEYKPTITQTYTDPATGEVTITYHVSFKVTFWTLPTSAATLSKTMTATGNQGVKDYVVGASGVGGSASVAGLKATVTGAIKPNGLVDSNGKGHVYFELAVKNDFIKYLWNKGEGYNVNEGKGYNIAEEPTALAVTIYDPSAKQLLKQEYEFELKDAAGRKQDTITVTVDATGATIEGEKKVTFKDAAGTVIQAGFATDGKVTPPEAPAHTADYYYTGNWKNGTAVVTLADGKYTPTGADETLTAEYHTITAKAPADRPNGPAGGGDDAESSFNYKDEYNKNAGMTLSGSTITINGAKLTNYLNAEKSNKSYLEKDEDGTTYVYYGLKIEKASGANKVTILNNKFEKVKENISLTENKADGSGNDVLNNELIMYFPVAVDGGGGVEFIGGEGSQLCFTRYFVWSDDSGIKRVTKLALTLNTTYPKIVTFKNEGETVATVAVAKGGTLGEAFPADLEDTEDGDEFAGWIDKDDKAFTKDTKVMDDMEITAKWTKAETQTPPENGGGGGTD